MGEEKLFETFLKERIDNLGNCILLYGIHGVLDSFECWLYGCDFVDRDAVRSFRDSL